MNSEKDTLYKIAEQAIEYLKGIDSESIGVNES